MTNIELSFGRFCTFAFVQSNVRTFQRSNVSTFQWSTILMFAILSLWGISFAQPLRPDHWASERVRHWQHRGLLWEMSPLERPWSGEKVSRTLIQHQTIQETTLQRYLEAWPDSNQVMLRIESLQEQLQQQNDDPFHSQWRATLSFRANDWLSGYGTFMNDNLMDDQPHYLGKEQGGMVGLMERAVIQIDRGPFLVRLGREHQSWGPGRDAQFLVSDHPRPMDFITASYRHRWFSYSWFAANLDPTRFAINGEPGYQRRYLAAHRLEIKPLPRLRIAVSEAIIFGGPEFSSHFAFFNPVTLYHSVQNNGPEGGNTIGTLSALWMPFNTLSLYGSVMIDDIQVEYSVPGDMEPDEIGWMLGSIWADPVSVRGLDLYAEYSRITNRTYNTPSPWEKWLHRREPIGHFLGNDFDRLMVGADYWPRVSWRAGLQYEHRRRGEGRIEKTFDTPWLDYTLEQGYSEPFPTGVVETSDILSASLTWQPRWWGRVFMQASHRSVDNSAHVTGNSDSYWTMQAGVQIDWGAKWQLP